MNRVHRSRPHGPTETRTFVVRAWLEPRDGLDAREEWRGHLMDVGSGERCFFNAMPDLLSLIRGLLESPRGGGSP